jgi:hypothetical protein
MSDEEWKDPFEENGVTLGPEEALRREIEKSKSLKVERLKLRDEIEKLRAENARLNQEIENQIQRPDPNPQASSPPRRWSLFLLIFNLCALGTLLYFILQK